MQTRQNDLQVSTGLASPVKQNNFINATIPIFALQAHEQDTPDMTLEVEGANNVVVGGKAFVASTQNSPTFTAPGSGTETHLLYAYNNSGTLTLAIKTSGFTSGDPSTYAVEYPLAEVEIATAQTIIEDSNITDVRPSNEVQKSIYAQNSIFN